MRGRACLGKLCQPVGSDNWGSSRASGGRRAERSWNRRRLRPDKGRGVNVGADWLYVTKEGSFCCTCDSCQYCPAFVFWALRCIALVTVCHRKNIAQRSLSQFVTLKCRLIVLAEVELGQEVKMRHSSLFYIIKIIADWLLWLTSSGDHWLDFAARWPVRAQCRQRDLKCSPSWGWIAPECSGGNQKV